MVIIMLLFCILLLKTKLKQTNRECLWIIDKSILERADDLAKVSEGKFFTMISSSSRRDEDGTTRTRYPDFNYSPNLFIFSVFSFTSSDISEPPPPPHESAESTTYKLNI